MNPDRWQRISQLYHAALATTRRFTASIGGRRGAHPTLDAIAKLGATLLALYSNMS